MIYATRITLPGSCKLQFVRSQCNGELRCWLIMSEERLNAKRELQSGFRFEIKAHSLGEMILPDLTELVGFKSSVRVLPRVAICSLT